MIKIISETEMLKLIDKWTDSYDDHTGPDHDAIPHEKYLCAASGGGWTACDNETGDCWTEDFLTKEYATRWLLGDYDDIDDLREEEKIHGHS